MRFLIVEDDATTRLILRKILVKFGIVHTARNGEEALLLFQQALDENDPYRIILLDIIMPGLDGQSALKEIRTREERLKIGPQSKAKVLMLTSRSDQASVISAFQSHCDAYLIKPPNKEKLLMHLRNFDLIS